MNKARLSKQLHGLITAKIKGSWCRVNVNYIERAIEVIVLSDKFNGQTTSKNIKTISNICFNLMKDESFDLIITPLRADQYTKPKESYDL